MTIHVWIKNKDWFINSKPRIIANRVFDNFEACPRAGEFIELIPGYSCFVISSIIHRPGEVEVVIDTYPTPGLAENLMGCGWNVNKSHLEE